MPGRDIPLVQRTGIALAAIWAALIVGLAAFQTWQLYSPVPVWDMWVGYLGFYEQAIAGNWAAWWNQLYEHRLLLSRILFWIDIRAFAGRSIFLLVVSYILLSTIAYMFWRLIHERAPEIKSQVSRLFVSIFITAWLFLSCQGENLTWAFQGQFFLAYLLPLCGFYFLQKSMTETGSLPFLFACACGALSAGAMANGVLALPLMLVFAIISRQGSIRTVGLALLTVITLLMYFYDYRPPSGHSLISKEFMNNISDGLLFIPSFLGNPFYFVFKKFYDSILIAQIFGFIFIALASLKAISILQHPRRNALQTGLLFFLAYIVASAAGAASGRIFMGVKQALAPHYTTPPIIGWATLAVLYAPEIASFRFGWKKTAVIPVVAFAILMTVFQFGALFRADATFFDRKATLLGLALGVHDDEKLQTLTDPPTYRDIPPIAEVAYARHLSLFGSYPYRGARERLGAQTQQMSSLPSCSGALTTIEASSDQRFVRVGGWLLDPKNNGSGKAVQLIDETGREIGYAILGQPRPDLATSIGPQASNAGFRGYAISGAAGKNVTIRDEARKRPLCQMSATVPDLLISFGTDTPTADHVTTDTRSILSQNDWLGADSYRSKLCGLRVLGSVISGDSDTGSVSLHLVRGDRILYRSGPTGGQQFLEIAGYPAITLPVTTDWTLINFTSRELPDGGFVAKFSDRGAGWGEWSAIAVKDGDSSRCP